jgi:hypothetical protein
VSRRLEEIGRRKQALIAQCAKDRAELRTFFDRIRVPVAATSLGLLIGKLLKARPLLITGIIGLLASRGAGAISRSARVIKKLFGWGRAAYRLWSERRSRRQARL